METLLASADPSPASAVSASMELIAANTRGKIRREKLFGREFYVADATFIVPGVLNGSMGPLFYPPDEVVKNPFDWNGMPLVGRHPVRDGKHVSARRPDILNEQGLGWAFGANAESNLTGQAWFDIENTRRYDQQLPEKYKIIPRLERGESIELSTGLLTQTVPGEGTFNGKSYVATARGYKPDHIAILPDEVGACSNRDGCGVLVNDDTDRSLFQRFKDWLSTNKPADDVEAIRTKALNQYIERGIESGAGTEEADQSGSAVTNEEPDMAKLSDTERTSLVDYLAANCDCWKAEGDREILNGLKDEKLASLKKAAETIVANAKKKPAEMEDDEEEDEEETPKKKKPAMNEQTTNTTKPVTANEWLASAPPEVRSAVQNAMEIERQAKQTIVAQLTTNTERQAKLMTFTLDDLRERLADAQEAARQAVANQQHIQAVAPNYLGAVGGTVTPKDDSDNVLPVIAINWDDMASPKLRRKQA